ncbi:MAG: hypothetical protein H6718_27390 [Polyangiaceae bacterium]|nr:hypothetical protein [Polyangiaceae bacterium]MCB9610029.1 hypothetical protein [Polyangiaceae bacterium]
MPKKTAWKKKFDAASIVARVSECRRSGANPRIEFEGGEGVAFTTRVHATVATLYSALEWPTGLEPEERHLAIGRGIGAIAAEKSITPENLLSSIQREAAKIHARAWQPFVVQTSVSLPHDARIRSRILACGACRFHRIQKWDLTAINHYLSDALPGGYDSPHFKWVTVHAYGRTENMALRRATHSFDVLRGIWNLSILHGTWKLYLGAHPKPLSRLTMGPLATLHDSSTHVPTGAFQYNQAALIGANQVWEGNQSNLFKFERRVANILKASNVLDFVQDGLVSYVRALDHAQPLDAFHGLWRVFEYLTGGLNGAYDTNVERALACYPARANHSYIRQELLHLQSLRNQLVHEGNQPPELSESTQQLLNHIHILLHNWIFVFGSFRSPEEVWAFLDLPYEESALRRLRSLADRSLALRYPRTIG